MLIVCGLLFSQFAWGRTSVLIVVQHDTSQDVDSCEQRLRAELSADGYAPTTVQVEQEPNAAVLVDTAKRLASSAAISIVLSEGSVSGLVWMVDPKKPGGLLRAVTELPVNDQASIVFAITATDVLHGGLLELGYVQDDPKIAPSLPDPVRKPEPAAPGAPELLAPAPAALPRTPLPSPPRHTASDAQTEPPPNLQATVSANRLFAIRGLPPSTEIDLAVTRRLGIHWAIGLHGGFVLPVELKTSRASASASQFLVGPRLEYWQQMGRWWSSFTFVETGLYYETVHGSSSTSVTGHDRSAFTIYHQLGGGVSFHASRDFGLWLGASVLLPYQPSDVVILEETVGRIASPSVLLGGGLLARF